VLGNRGTTRRRKPSPAILGLDGADVCTSCGLTWALAKASSRRNVRIHCEKSETYRHGPCVAFAPDRKSTLEHRTRLQTFYFAYPLARRFSLPLSTGPSPCEDLRPCFVRSILLRTNHSSPRSMHGSCFARGGARLHASQRAWLRWYLECNGSFVDIAKPQVDTPLTVTHF
jgi:hypothetical protein